MTVQQAPVIIHFDADVPKNAFSHDDPTRCEHCGVLTAPEYSACSDCPTEDKTYYCSRHCQSRDWEACHEGYCARKKFYAATRHIHLSPSDANNTDLSRQIHDAADMGSVKVDVPDWYIRYLTEIPPAKRPAKLLSPSADYARKSSDVRDIIVRLAEGTTTPDEHQARATDLWQTTYAGKALGEIPFGDRPCYILAAEGERSRRGILVVVDDFEEISAEFFKHFMRASVFVDPWALTRRQDCLVNWMLLMGRLEESNSQMRREHTVEKLNIDILHGTNSSSDQKSEI